MFEIELVTERPIAGEEVEVNFGRGCDLLWVRFTDGNYADWIGKFELGSTFGKKIAKLTERIAIVLANGNIFFVDVYSRTIEKQLDNDFYYGFWICEEQSKLILDDALRLYVYDFHGNFIHKTKRFSLDGVSYERVSGSTLFGKYNDTSEDWGGFEYDFLENRIRCGWSMK